MNIYRITFDYTEYILHICIEKTINQHVSSKHFRIISKDIFLCYKMVNVLFMKHKKRR